MLTATLERQLNLANCLYCGVYTADLCRNAQVLQRLQKSREENKEFYSAIPIQAISVNQAKAVGTTSSCYEEGGGQVEPL